VIDRSKLPNSFEFVVVAGARARQLMRGAQARVTAATKPVTTAQREVIEGAVAPESKDGAVEAPPPVPDGQSTEEER